MPPRYKLLGRFYAFFRITAKPEGILLTLALMMGCPIIGGKKLVFRLLDLRVDPF